MKNGEDLSIPLLPMIQAMFITPAIILLLKSDGNTDIPEPDLDVFKCGNYGEGTWVRISDWSKLASWNPNTSPTDTTGTFTVSGSNEPYGDNEIYWTLMNSSHLNATIDDIGRIHYPGVWGLNNCDGYYYPNFQYTKEVIFDPALPEGSQFKVNEIWPQKDPENDHDEYYQPWDNVPPWEKKNMNKTRTLGNGIFPIILAGIFPIGIRVPMVKLCSSIAAI
jgi:hypothetical protein